MTKLLISGIPGTGKTTVAEHLAKHFGFRHIDMEADFFAARRELAADSDRFLGSLAAEENVVLSWGFSPYTERPLVDKVLQSGFTFVWFDGDRVTSLKNFLRREANDPHEEANYYGQMMLILSTEIANAAAIHVDPFKDDTFRPIDDIAKEILAHPEARQ